MRYDCYKTPGECTFFDFRGAWHDYRGADGYSILGNDDWQSYTTPEVDEILEKHRGGTFVLENIADELSRRHDEEYKVGTLRGCVQGEWQYIIYPATFESELPYIEQEYFNLCDEWRCVPENGHVEDGMYCFTYPFDKMDAEEQLAFICMCDEVVLHYPRQTYVWD